MGRHYVGLANSFHDSALAIVDEAGEVLFAEASERYLQNKRSLGVAPDLFRRAAELVAQFCEGDDEIVVATTWSDQTPGLMAEGLKRTLRAQEQYRKAFGEPPPFVRRQRAAQQFFFEAQGDMVRHPGHLLAYELAQLDLPAAPRLQHRSYEHHLTHAAAACYSSPFDEALCAVLDGMGERTAFACFHYKDGKLTDLSGSQDPTWASLGYFYGLVCETCGFGSMSGEEWKVMGLASYGTRDPKAYALFREMLRVDGLRLEFPPGGRLMQLQRELYEMRRRPGEPAIGYANLARAGQDVFTEVLFEYLTNLHGAGGSDNLVLAGGCALNSSANGQIVDATPFRSVHVFCAPGDDGNAVGAPLLAHAEDHPRGRARRTAPLSPYLGSGMSPETLSNVERFGDLPVSRCNGQAPRLAAARLAAGQIVGWIQGAAEFGPRALGNRSILADPRSASIKETINARVKFREEFRPFAPSILHEHGPSYFENYQESPYMERTLRFRPEVRERVPGVVHVDGTGRLQTVKEAWNPGYHALISAFHQLTGIPLVLNTSFNVMGKPISHSVEDALAVFFTSGLDALFIDDVLIEKNRAGAAQAA